MVSDGPIATGRYRHLARRGAKRTALPAGDERSFRLARVARHVNKKRGQRTLFYPFLWLKKATIKYAVPFSWLVPLFALWWDPDADVVANYIFLRNCLIFQKTGEIPMWIISPFFFMLAVWGFVVVLSWKASLTRRWVIKGKPAIALGLLSILVGLAYVPLLIYWPMWVFAPIFIIIVIFSLGPMAAVWGFVVIGRRKASLTRRRVITGKPAIAMGLFAIVVGFAYASLLMYGIIVYGNW